MSQNQFGRDDGRPLGTLGVSEAEERLYRWLLAHPGLSAPEVAEVRPYGLRKVQQLVNSLESIGFVTHSPERPRRYFATSPDIAVEALVRDRRNDIESALRVVPELQRTANSVGKNGPVVELITNRAAIRQVFEKMSEMAQEEVLGFVRLPILVSRVNVEQKDHHPLQREAMRRGVRYRSIADSDFLESPDGLRSLHDDVLAGEEVRVVSYLPLKLMISDHRLGILPPNPTLPENPSLLVYPSALLDALHYLFEILWERAAPISFNRHDELKISDVSSPFPDVASDLVTFLSAGLNDKAMIGEMGISRRTLLRRISELMKHLGARTRFQAGWLAALEMVEAKSERL